MLLFAFYSLLRFNTGIRQIGAELDVSYWSLHRRVERFARTLDAPRIDLICPVKIDEFYVSAGKKGRERDGWSRLRGRGSYDEDKPPVFVLVDRGSNHLYVIPSKSADESTVRHLLDNHEDESLTVFTDGFRAYDPLEKDETYQREAVIHGEGGYVDGATRRCCDGGSRPIEASRRTNSPRISDSSNFAEKSYANPDETP